MKLHYLSGREVVEIKFHRYVRLRQVFKLAYKKDEAWATLTQGCMFHSRPVITGTGSGEECTLKECISSQLIGIVSDSQGFSTSCTFGDCWGIGFVRAALTFGLNRSFYDGGPALGSRHRAIHLPSSTMGKTPFWVRVARKRALRRRMIREVLERGNTMLNKADDDKRKDDDDRDKGGPGGKTPFETVLFSFLHDLYEARANLVVASTSVAWSRLELHVQ
ncbi:unnamed protein product, partial [Symbiodinium sp. KB8]